MNSQSVGIPVLQGRGGCQDIASFASQLAEKLDKDFVGRAEVAHAFADGLSELGARWLAEVVTSFHARRR